MFYASNYDYSIDGQLPQATSEPSDTPRTDALTCASFLTQSAYELALTDFARDLERELAGARAESARLLAELRTMREMHADALVERNEARAESARLRAVCAVARAALAGKVTP